VQPSIVKNAMEGSPLATRHEINVGTAAKRKKHSTKGTTARRYLYDSQDQLRQCIDNFVSAYRFVCKISTAVPERFGLASLA
jgi:hypothetical protein